MINFQIKKFENAAFQYKKENLDGKEKANSTHSHPTPKIKILVGYHKPAVLLKDEILTPIHLGRALATQSSKDGVISKEDYEWMCENMIGDDTGDNISHLNRYFCELSGIYWAWKNYDKLDDPDYIGFMHYRRHFIFDEEAKLAPRIWDNYYPTYTSADENYLNIINPTHLRAENIDLVTPESFNVLNVKSRGIEFCSIKDFVRSYSSDISLLYELENLIKQDYEKYKTQAIKFYEQNSYYPCNMFIMRKELFFEYCNFIFSLMFKLQNLWKKPNIYHSDAEQERQLAWTSEFISDIFFKNKKARGINLKELPVAFVLDMEDKKLEKHFFEKNLFHQISQHKIVSFDLFDTLLVRPYCYPQDVFEHLEKNYNAKGFAELRAKAEALACKKFKQKQVNFEEIYNILPSKFKFLKDKEFELEKQTLYLNTSMVKIFNEALNLKKEIIITSDMYFSQEQIQEILDEKGIKGYKKLYVSSTNRKTKHQKNLYEYILKDLQCHKNEILHIGDNIYSDYKCAKEVGIHAFHIKPPLQCFLEQYPKIAYLFNNHHSLSTHIMIAMFCKKWLENGKKFQNYWDCFAYCYAAAPAYALAHFIFKKAINDKIDSLAFIARDGFGIEKIFNLLQNKHKTSIKTAYVYASRSLFNIIDMQEALKNKAGFWTQRFASIMLALKNDFKELRKIPNSKLNTKQTREFVKKNENELKDLSLQKKDLYENYLKSLTLSGKTLGIFDISTVTFRAQNTLAKVLNFKKCIGYYFLVNSETNVTKKNPQYRSFVDIKKINLINYPMIEFLITAPEFPVLNINNDTSFSRLENSYEEERNDKVALFIKAQLDFTQDILATFKDFEVSFDFASIVHHLNIFENQASQKDREEFKDIYFCMDEAHSIYHRLLPLRPYSFFGAPQRIKKHLSYKLGFAMIQAKNFKSILILPFTLTSIILKHKKEQKLYNFLKELQPQLNLPPIYTYLDYEEALKVKKQLSYRLGQAFLMNPLSFIFKITRIYKAYKKETKN